MSTPIEPPRHRRARLAGPASVALLVALCATPAAADSGPADAGHVDDTGPAADSVDDTSPPDVGSHDAAESDPTVQDATDDTQVVPPTDAGPDDPGGDDISSDTDLDDAGPLPDVAIVEDVATTDTSRVDPETRGDAATGDTDRPDSGDTAPGRPCTTDLQCGDGFRCVASPITCVTEPCTPQGGRCIAIDCAFDVDCPADLVCLATTWEVCDEATGGPVSCQPFDATFCGPRWLAECVEDADCGDGFSCEDERIRSCSVGGCDPAGGDCDGSADPVCTELPTGLRTCRIQVIVCTEDADCPVDWYCEDGDAPVCSGDPAGCPPRVDDGQCLPPFWSQWSGAASSETWDESVRGAVGADGSSGNVRVERVDSDPVAGVDAGTGVPTVPPRKKKADGGCAVSPSDAAPLWLLGVPWVVWRRRRATRRRQDG